MTPEMKKFASPKLKAVPKARLLRILQLIQEAAHDRLTLEALATSIDYFVFWGTDPEGCARFDASEAALHARIDDLLKRSGELIARTAAANQGTPDA